MPDLAQDDVQGLRAVADSAEFKQLADRLNEFCPFAALGVTHNETRHSNLLAYFCDPREPHGYGSTLLEALLRALSVDVQDCEGAQIWRERARIDILICLPAANTVVAIELKIEASEHGDQLRRYRDYVEQQWPGARWRHHFIFLTKYGLAPSLEHGEGWRTGSLEELVTAFQDVTFSTEATHSTTFLEAYLKMVRRQHLPDEEGRELAHKLWREHRDALDYLMAHRPDLLESLTRRQDELADRIAEATGLNIVPDGPSRRIIRFAASDWDEFVCDPSVNWPGTRNQRLVLLEVKNEGDALSAHVYLGPGQGENRERIFRRLAPTDASMPPPSAWFELAGRDYEGDATGGFEPTDVENVMAFVVRFAKDHLPWMDKQLRGP